MRRNVSIAAAVAALLAAAPAGVAAQFQEHPPEPGPLRPYEVPRVHDFQLANGVRVVVVPQPAMPIVTARILVDAGAIYEPAERGGLASLTGSLLSEGIPGTSGAEIARRMEQMGAQYGTGAGQHQVSASVTALKSAFPEALALAARTVVEPTFPEEEVARLRTQAVAAHVQSRSRVEGLASEVFWRALFGAEAPYGRRSAGTAATLEGITRDDVVDYHRRAYSPANTTLLLVGDVTVDEARALAESSLGGWRAPAARLPRVANVPQAVSGTRVLLVDRPGSVQSSLYVGQPTMGQGAPDQFAMLALSQVLGGGFSGRVNLNLRERHGWTYGAFTSFAPLQDVGAFFVATSVRTTATDSALVEAVGEYRRIAVEPVAGDELRAALAMVVGSFPSSVQTVQGLAGRMETVIAYGLPLDYWDTYRERLAVVTPEDVARMGRGHLTPDALTIVVAGDLEAIEAPIRALNLGAVEVWDADGNRLR